MTTSTGLRPITTLLAAVLTVPLVTMGIVVPLLALVDGDGMFGGAGGMAGGGLQMVMPLVPLTLLAVFAYVLYTYGGRRDRSRTPHSTLTELRTAYARGDLSDEQFQTRRDRLQTESTDGDGATDD